MNKKNKKPKVKKSKHEKLMEDQEYKEAHKLIFGPQREDLWLYM